MMRMKKDQVLTVVGVTLAGVLAAGVASCNAPAEQAPTNDNTNTAGNDPVTVVANNSETTDYAAFAAEEIQRAFSLTADSAMQGIAATSVYYCSSPSPRSVDTGKGSITVTVDDVAPVGRSLGDSYTTIYHQCVQATRTLDGTSSFVIDRYSGEPELPPPATWIFSATINSTLTITTAASSRVEENYYTYVSNSLDGITYTHQTRGSSSVVLAPKATPTKNRGFMITTYDNYNTKLYEHLIERYSQIDALRTEVFTGPSLVGPVGTQGRPPSSGAIVVRVSTIGTGPVVCHEVPIGMGGGGGMVGAGGGAAGGMGGAGGGLGGGGSMGGGATTTVCAASNTLISVTTITAIAGGNARVDVDSNGDGVIDSTTTVPWSVATHDLLD